MAENSGLSPCAFFKAGFTLKREFEVSSTLFSPRSLARYLQPQDPSVFNFDLSSQRDRIFNEASNRIILGQIDFSLMNRSKINKKNYVSYSDYATVLLLRSLAGHIKKRHKIVLSTRDNVVRRVIQSAMDATPMIITRRDIKSFYETIPTEGLKNLITHDSASSDIVRGYFEKFFAVHCMPSQVGLPRGIGLTTILAELVLKDFDERVRNGEGVYRYFRFSDDILIVSTQRSSQSDILLSQALPHPLEFNLKKTENIELPAPSKGFNEKRSFSFLGYEYVTQAQNNGREKSREVSIRIASVKYNRMKSRLHLTYKSFARTGNFSVFFDRIKYLSFNFRSRRGKININRKRWYAHSGIYYNYKFCGTYQIEKGKRKIVEFDCVQLKELDGLNHSLLRRFALSGQIILSMRQVDRLRRLSFFQGYRLKIHARFTGDQISAIKRCWTNAG